MLHIGRTKCKFISFRPLLINRSGIIYKYGTQLDLAVLYLRTMNTVGFVHSTDARNDIIAA